jgi:hypothetical protein
MDKVRVGSAAAHARSRAMVMKRSHVLALLAGTSVTAVAALYYFATNRKVPMRGS